ncbi:15378_t:CDS:2, partial [Dentiscutata heterogama]
GSEKISPIILLDLALAISVFAFLVTDRGGINNLAFDLLDCYFSSSIYKEVKEDSGVVGAVIEEIENSLNVIDTLLLCCAVELLLSIISDDLQDANPLLSINLLILWEFVIPK